MSAAWRLSRKWAGAPSGAVVLDEQDDVVWSLEEVGAGLG